MKLLADENMRRDIVDWLRAIGHDVVWIAETNPGLPDEIILDMAIRFDLTNWFASTRRCLEFLSTSLAANRAITC